MALRLLGNVRIILGTFHPALPVSAEIIVRGKEDVSLRSQPNGYHHPD